MRTHAAAGLSLLVLPAACGGGLSKAEIVSVEEIGTQAQKAQHEYRRLTGKIGFTECGGGV